MLLKNLFACILITGAAGNVFSQTVKPDSHLQNNLPELSVGETVPDVTVTMFLDDSARQVRLSELYRDKILIIDFWATWCGACVGSFAETKSLKKEFSGKIDFLLVSYEERKKVLQFNRRFKFFDDQILNTITDDTLFMKLFRHLMIPHLVWIDRTGKIIAITDKDKLTSRNLERALDNQLAVKTKKDNLAFDPGKPFHLRDSNYLFRSILTTRTDEIASYSYILNQPMIDRIFISNLSIAQLYSLAAFQEGVISFIKDKLVLETKDSLKFLSPEEAPYSFRRSGYENRSQWADENTYCYELQFPRAIPVAEMSRFMIEDLNRYFNLNGRFELRKLPCLVLKGRGKAKKLKAGEQDKPAIYSLGTGDVRMQNQGADKLAYLIAKCLKFSRVLNNTGIHYAITMDLKGISSGMSEKEVNRILKPYGLHLKKAKRKVNVFVLSEKRDSK